MNYHNLNLNRARNAFNHESYKSFELVKLQRSFDAVQSSTFATQKHAKCNNMINHDEKNDINRNKRNEDIVFISAESCVSNDSDVYFGKGSNCSTLKSCKSVNLLYPVNLTEVFPLVEPLKNGFNPVYDLVKTAQFLAEDCSDAFGDPYSEKSRMTYHELIDAASSSNWTMVNNVVEKCNKQMTSLILNGHYNRKKIGPLSQEQSEILLEQIYSRCVTNPEALRSYKGFSKEVYGETGQNLIRKIIHMLNLRTDDVFLDLGSGIGNVVLQIAAETGCNCYGIEFMDIPNTFARAQLREFKSRLYLYGHEVPGSVHLRKGDFMEDTKVHKIIEKADVIFVNNFAFDAETNQKLKHLFLGMKEGAQIVSFQAFRPLDYTISHHNMNDISSILDVKKAEYEPNSVSWTASPGEFYIHTINRKPLHAFMNNSKVKL